MTSRAGKLGGSAVCLLTALLTLHCSRGEPPGAAEREALAAVPHPNLTAADEKVREHIDRQRKQLEDQLAREPPDPERTAEAFADLGVVYVVYDFPDAAQTCFDNARRLAPDDFRWHYLLGYVRLLQGEMAEGTSLMEKSHELRSDFLPAMLRLGRAQLELGDRRAARRWFEAALAVDGSSAAALEGLGKLAAAEGDPAAAVEYFQQALAQAPSATSLHYALGQAYRDLGRLDEARRELERSGDAPVPIPDPLISPLAALAESLQLYLMQGAEALSDKNFELAAVAYERALEQDPTSFMAYKALSYSLEKLGDLDSAIRWLEVGLEKGSTDDQEKDQRERAELHRALGGLEALRRRDAEAIEHLGSSLRLRPDQPAVELKLGNALARLGRLEEALEHYDRLLESSPEYAPDLLEKRATLLINLSRTEEALADFQRALELRPDDGRLRLRYAEALEYLGKTDLAAEQRRLATAAEAGDPQRIAALLEAASEQIRRGRFEAALERLSEVLSIAPERHAARFERASVLGHLERYEEAVSEFRRILEDEPRHAGARRGEITALILLGRYGEARVRLNEALRIFSLDARLAHLQARLLASAPDPRVRDGELALEVATRLHRAVGGLRVQETLAMAYAEMGRFDKALELQRPLVIRAEQSGDDGLARDLRAKLVSFESGNAWSAAGPEEILDATLGSGQPATDRHHGAAQQGRPSW